MVYFILKSYTIIKNTIIHISYAKMGGLSTRINQKDQIISREYYFEASSSDQYYVKLFINKDGDYKFNLYNKFFDLSAVSKGYNISDFSLMEWTKGYIPFLERIAMETWSDNMMIRILLIYLTYEYKYLTEKKRYSIFRINHLISAETKNNVVMLKCNVDSWNWEYLPYNNREDWLYYSKQQQVVYKTWCYDDGKLISPQEDYRDKDITDFIADYLDGSHSLIHRESKSVEQLVHLLIREFYPAILERVQSLEHFPDSLCNVIIEYCCPKCITR